MRIYPEFLGGLRGAALLGLRLVVGSAFMFHGWSKIQHPFAWMGPDAWAPGFLQALAALSEFGGGAALIVGLLTPLACLGIASTMAVAAFGHHIPRGDPFVGQGASYELALVYLLIALAFIALGPGAYSLDALIFGKKKEP